MISEICIQELWTMAGDPAHEQEHEADMIFGFFPITGHLDARLTEPSTQGQRSSTEDDAFAIGVHRTPRRCCFRSGAYEEPPVFAGEILIHAKSKTLIDQGEGFQSLLRLCERPLTSRLLHLKGTERPIERSRFVRTRLVKEKGTGSLPRKATESKICSSCPLMLT